MAQVLYLHRVNQTYYFRIKIPQDIKQWFDSAEIKRSLRTKVLTSAKRLIILWAAKTEKLFTTIRTGLLAGIMTGKEIRKLIDEYIGIYLEKDDEARIDYGVPASIHETEDGPIWITNRAEFDPDVEAIAEELAENRYDIVSRLLDEFLQDKGIKVGKTSYDYKRLCRDIALAHVDEIHPINVNRDMGIFTDNYYLQKEARGEPVVQSTGPILQSNDPEAKKPFLFSELIQEYARQKRLTGRCREVSLNQTLTNLELFTELLGDPDVKTLKREHFVDCLEKITKIPSGRATKLKYKNMTLDEILRLDSIPDPLGIGTIRTHFTVLSSLMNWAVQNEYVTRNYAEGLAPKDNRSDDELRVPYDNEELKKLVAGLVTEKSESPEKHHCWFVPIISLFSGLRMDEACQLHKEDIKQVDGIWCFNVNDDGDKKLKRKKSKRIVPIHPALIKMGLIEYAQGVNHKRIWPALRKTGRGYSGYWSTWYSTFNRTNVTEDSRKTFHSLRKNFSNSLKQARVQDTIIGELLGHAPQTLAMGTYSNSYDVSVLFDEIKKIDYGIDLSGLKWTS